MAQMKIPDKVRVGPIDYTVNVCKMKDLGRYDNTKSEIKINQESEIQQKVLTLFHEVTHAVLFEAGLEEYDNEVLVNIVSSGMVSFLRDNQSMLEFLRKKE